jgi:hypothetical protein
LDANTLITSFGITQNYYDGFDVLQGTDTIELQPNDYIEIRYLFTGTLPMGGTDEIGGYLNINYITHKAETI